MAGKEGNNIQTAKHMSKWMIQLAGHLMAPGAELSLRGYEQLCQRLQVILSNLVPDCLTLQP